MARIVVDTGHGGTTAVGGSSPNNATSVSGLLEKNLTLESGDMPPPPSTVSVTPCG